MDFKLKLSALVAKNNSLLCVGLDPDITKLPEALSGSETPYFSFNKAIIDATADLVCAFKPNSAFYEARGAGGIEELKQTCMYLQQRYPEIPIILDFKRGDIGNTNNNYADFAFDYLGVDAVTIQPYQGQAAVQSFLDYKDKGIIILCRTSNTGAGEFQDLEVGGRKLYMTVADNVVNNWNANDNCLLVVGATAPEELAEIRQLVGDDMTFLVPGIGAQGGDVEATVKAGRNASGTGMIINSSRAILYADSSENFADVARQKAQAVKDEINKYRGGSQ
ncbi:MAG: orotidine-5'-phosphate decarboxylase [Patescibacteria group bacterium]